MSFSVAAMLGLAAQGHGGIPEEWLDSGCKIDTPTPQQTLFTTGTHVSKKGEEHSYGKRCSQKERSEHALECTSVGV